MKSFLTVILFCCSLIAVAQTSEFLSLESKIKDHIKNGRWDELVVTAPDLVIADPTRGDGYYYTAMAFLKLNQPEKAEEYLAMAEPLADKKLQDSIEKLKKDIIAYREANQVLESAERHEKQGSKKAADEWKRLWEMEPSNIEYALNAVELYVEQKNYPQALEILKSPSMASDPGARELLKRINSTPEMHRINGYNDAMALGKQNMKNKNFSTAISNFSSALKFQPNDKEALQYKKMAEDDLAWEKTRTTNTLEAFESYVNGKTILQYKAEADNIIQRALVRFGNKAATERRFSDMEYYFTKYEKQYPKGSEIAANKKTMCEAYLAASNEQKHKKEEVAQKRVVEYLTRVKSLCVAPAGIDDDIRTAQRKSVRYGRPNRGFMAYVYDSLTPLGVSFGTINNTKLGMYVTVRANEDFFKGTGYYTTNDDGEFDTDIIHLIQPTGNTRTAHFDGVLGLTKKIAFPLWLYAGGGVNYSVFAIEVDEYNSSGRKTDTEWVKNKDRQLYKPVVEAGAIIDVGGFQVRGGGKMVDFKDIYYSLGVGFSFRRGG
ncbi:MAG TPA: hypothetical protein VIK80_08860 [Flavihumibacter sp.]